MASVDAPPKLVCPRHKVETPLTCVTCGTPICPKCYVRTAVGLRCPTCAAGVTVKIGRRPRWPFVVAGLAVVAVLAIVLLTRGSDSNGGAVPDDVVERETGAGGAAAGYRVESRPAQGYSVEIPVRWQAAPDNSDTTLSYAEARPSEGSLRVSVNPTDGTVADAVARLSENLRAQGAQDLTQTPTEISGVPALRVDYRFPTSPTPGSTLSTHSSYLVVRNGTVYSFQLATTDPGGKSSIFEYMASKFALL